jgi:hypothetical protein
MRIQEKNAEREFKAYLDRIHVQHVPFGILLSIGMAFPSALEFHKCYPNYKSIYAVELALNIASLVIFVVGYFVSKHRYPHVVPFFSTLAFTCLLAQKFISMLDESGQENMTIEFGTNLCLFHIYF